MRNASTLLVLAVCGAAFAPAAAGASSRATGLGDVRLKGYLGERLDRMIERHVGGTDIDYVTEPFLGKTERHGWWQTEFWGKYMQAAVPFAAYSGSAKIAADVRRGVDRILASQEESGYVGNYPDELRCGEGWDVWGMKYTLMGLLRFYDAVLEKKGTGNWERGTGNGELGRGNGEQGTGNGEEGQRVLAAAKRLCDYVIGEIGPGGRRGRELWQTGNWSGMASSSILEPVVWLCRRVAAAEGEAAAQRYLDFAAYIVKGMSEPAAGPRLVDLALKGVSVADRNGYGNVADTLGGYVIKHNRWKAYEMMSCYQGILDYVEARGNGEWGRGNWEQGTGNGERGNGEELERLFRSAALTAEDIAQEEVNLAGGCAASEAWYHGASRQHLAYECVQETCVTTTWMRLCEKLLEMTDDPKWADRLERSFYNAYLGALKPDGSSFAAYTPLSGTRWGGMDHCHMHTDCCTANGPRGFLCFLRAFFASDGKTATFNFYSSALVRGFDMYSRYPRADSARIVSRTAGPLALRLHIPAWSAKTVVKVNGVAQADVRPGTYFTVSRDWALGDVVEVAFDMPVVAHVRDSHVAYTRGPVLLARDSRFADGDLMEPLPPRAVSDGEAMAGFAPTVVPDESLWMAFSASLPLGQHKENQEARNPTTVFFCDFASAGVPWGRTRNYRTWFPVERLPSEGPSDP